jgi:hypothetical protein
LATVTATTTVRQTDEVTITETVSASASVEPGGGPGGVIPVDFQEYPGGIYADFETDHESFNCVATDEVCWGIKVITTGGCPNGVKIKLSVYDVGGDVVRSTIEDSQSDALAPLDLRTYVVGTPEQIAASDVEAEITDVDCAEV